MPTGPMRVRDWVGPTAFYSGLCVIGAAGGIHIMFERIAGAESLPPLLANWCAHSGKAGTTLACVFIGLFFMLVGAAVSRSRSDPSEARSPSSRVTDVPLFTPPEKTETEPSVTSYGRVVLRTQRYVSSQSGTPERGVPRNPQ